MNQEKRRFSVVEVIWSSPAGFESMLEIVAVYFMTRFGLEVLK